ncbi:MAG: Ppx/GppA phosphatase family protein [Armatimonadota bacterium]|nr:Ppx/GppA phosphatase family protein [Armatimonadota bacterium]MDR5703329.1 Ppx/GppA phosphatase family protein [Armatimonadota bacterium]
MAVMRLAAIDVGTNSVRLLVAEVFPGRIQPLYQAQVITRLGEGLARSGLLRSSAIIRTVEAVDSFVEEARARGAVEVHVVATQAVREAANREEVLAALRERGLRVWVLSGEEEATLGFLGATAGLSPREDPPSAGPVLVIDVGGGSTELAWGGEKVEGVVSLPVGAVRLTEEFLTSDPPSPPEITAARNHLLEVFRAIPSLHPSLAIGTGGTLTALSAFHHRIIPYTPERVHGSSLSREEIEHLLWQLASIPLEERRKLPAIQPERADILVAGALLCGTIMDSLSIRRITVSEADLLWGILVHGVTQ